MNLWRCPCSIAGRWRPVGDVGGGRSFRVWRMKATDVSIVMVLPLRGSRGMSERAPSARGEVRAAPLLHLVSGGGEDPADDRGLRTVLKDLLGLRLPEGRSDAEGPGMDVPGLRDDPRPGPERRDQYQTIRTCKATDQRRRACGPAPGGEGDDSREARSRKRGVVHACGDWDRYTTRPGGASPGR